MINYINLSAAGQAAFAVCAILLMMGAVFLFIWACVLHIGRRYTLWGLTFAVVMMLILQGINDASNCLWGGIKSATIFGRITGSLPYNILIFAFEVIAAAQVLLFAVLLHRKKYLLTKGAIKENLDSLPDGVCFYNEDGQPLLINRQMHIISGELFDREILNAKSFQSRLLSRQTREGTEIVCTEPTLIAKTSDGRVWDFRCSLLSSGKLKFYELIAFDITEQYRLNTELTGLNKRLNDVNERLKRLSVEMAAFVEEKELLNAKIDVHDNIGRAILACRTYLMQNREERNRNDLLFLWRNVFAVMRNEELSLNKWDLLKKTADVLGIAIEIKGKFPENLKIKAAIFAAIRECLTNTANHAQGDRLFVNISENAGTVSVEITNTGKSPRSEIQEKGGLKNLRYIVEDAKGNMTIECIPQFLLRLEFQKEEMKWLKQEYWL